MKAYKLEILIIDFDEVGLDDIKEIIENTNYPNDCINPNVMDILSVDIGEWHDEHPLNNYKTVEAEYNRLLKNNIMKEYKTTIVDGYVLIVDDSEIKENTNTFNEGLNCDWFWNSIYNKIANTGDITSFDYKIIAHLPLNNYAVLQGVPILPPIKKDDDVEKLAEERFGTDIDSIRGSNPYDLNSDLKRGFTIGYNKHAEKYKYTEQDLRIAVELAITTGLTVDYFIARHEQPKFPISFNCEMKQKFEADKYKRKDIKNGVYYEPKTISTPNGEQWVGEWVY